MTAAFDMARRSHNETTIKGTNLPYLLHLLDVSAIALRHGADEDQATAALLHDAVEDGGGAQVAGEIRAEFGDRVADIVLGCSDSVVADASSKPPWWQRKVQYIDHLADASPDVAFVSAADKLSNVRSILTDLDRHGDDLWSRFKTGRAGTLWYYRTLARVLPGQLPETDGAERLGHALVESVSQLIDAVGTEAATADWQQATAEVDRVRLMSEPPPPAERLGD